MSIQAVAWALEQDLPARPKLVLVSIANHASHTDGYCWLKAETIAKEAACTPRSIYNFVGALIRNGFIRKSLRKGEDGKQRATDYWILFDREEKPWDQDASLESDEAEGDGSETAPADDPPQDIVEPHERRSGGETALPQEPSCHRQPVDIPAGSGGPSESGFHRKRIAEPSKPNPKAEGASASVHARPPRGYRPPPPQPLGATIDTPAKMIFVYFPSRAYDAWAKHEARKSGLRTWSLTTRALIDGQWRTGWYFPTLFPPEQPPQTSDDSKSRGPPAAA